MGLSLPWSNIMGWLLLFSRFYRLRRHLSSIFHGGLYIYLSLGTSGQSLVFQHLRRVQYDKHPTTV
jgi:hypothetical protein